MFYMEEMRQLVRSYDEVIQRYYVQYLYGYDAIVLNETVQNLSVSRALRLYVFPGASPLAFWWCSKT